MSDPEQKQITNSYLNPSGKKYDILKFLLCLMVLVTHTTPVSFLSPLLRLAVPLFFLMSSFFFFNKLNKINQSSERLRHLMKYIKRTLNLYFFWFILLFPATFFIRKWYALDVLTLFEQIIRGFLCSSTFVASWFLMASIEGVVIVFFLSKWLSNKWLLLLGGFLYLVCSLSTNYYHLFSTWSGIFDGYSYYVSVIGQPYGSYPASLFYIVAGKILAEKPKFISNGLLSFFITLSILLIYVEYFAVRYYGWYQADDCYIMLMPLSIMIFILIGQNAIKINRDTINLRNASIIIYCFHGSFARILGWVIKNNGIHIMGLRLVVTLFVSIVIAYLLIKWEKKKGFYWLKCCH